MTEKHGSLSRGASTLANVTGTGDSSAWADWLRSVPGEQQSSVEPLRAEGVNFTIRKKAGETWLLVNEGPSIVYMVEIEGLADLDKRRLLEVDVDPMSLGVGQAKEFVFASRYTLSGTGNVVVSYHIEPGGSTYRLVVEVPAP